MIAPLDREITSDGLVSTLFEFTSTEQSPGNIKVDRAGNLYLSDREHNVIYKLAGAPAPVSTARNVSLH